MINLSNIIKGITNSFNNYLGTSISDKVGFIHSTDSYDPVGAYINNFFFRLKNMNDNIEQVMRDNNNLRIRILDLENKIKNYD